MERHLLVAISDNVKALHGVKFIADFFDDLSAIKVTLFAVLPPHATDWETGKTQAPQEMRAKFNKANAAFGAALKKSRAILEEAGMPAENIAMKSEVCKRTNDFHLTLESADGNYEALVLGRRGLESLYQLFEESLTERLFNNGLALPCWACRKHQPGRKNILLCIDKSPRTAELVDHVADMLDEAPSHNITLFHVATPGEDQDSADTMLNDATDLLIDSGISTSRIVTKVAQGIVPAKAILKEAEEGRYAVVAVGRKGEPKGWLRKLFTGSTSRALLNDLNGAALWFAN